MTTLKLTAAPAPTSPDAETLGRVRWSLLTMYGVFGLIAMSWMGRLPSVRDDLGIAAAQLGVILLVGSIGGLIGVVSVGSVIARFGGRMTMWFGLVGAAAGFTVAAAGLFIGSAELFAIGLFLNGLSSASNDIPINIEGSRVEQLSGKSLLPLLHGAFCVGSLLGTGVAAVTAILHVSVAWHILIVAILVTAARLWLIAGASELADTPLPRVASAQRSVARTAPKAHKSGALAAWTEKRTLLIGFIMLAANMSGAAAANWMNIGAVDGFRVSESTGAAVYMAYVAAMLIVRIFGAQITDRYSRVTIMRTSIIAAVAGIVAFALAPTIALGFVGAALWGAASSLIWPLGTQAAADNTVKAAARVSVVNSIATVSNMAIPPILGLLASAWGIRHGMLLAAVGLAASLLIIGAVRPERSGAAVLVRSTATVDDGANRREFADAIAA